MLRTSSFIALVAACGLAACQPQKTPEQLAAEKVAAAITAMSGAVNGQQSPLNPADAAAAGQAMSAAIQAGVAGALNDPNMSAEDKAKAQAMMGAIASGKTNPAAEAWLSGANKAFVILRSVKDDASAAAAKVQLAPIYAEMTGPAATLSAMSEDDRAVAFGPSMSQYAALAMNGMSLMMPLANNQELAKKVGDLLEAMPSPEK